MACPQGEQVSHQEGTLGAEKSLHHATLGFLRMPGRRQSLPFLLEHLCPSRCLRESGGTCKVPRAEHCLPG